MLSAAVLLGGAVAVQAATNLVVRQEADGPIRYTGRVQMHNVPLEFKGPDQLRREEERNAAAARFRPSGSSAELQDGAFRPSSAPAPLPPPPARRKDEEEDNNWLKPSDPGGKPTGKREASGWGWLADEVRRSDEQRSQDATRTLEEDEETRGTGGVSNRVSDTGLDRPESESRQGRDTTELLIPSVSFAERDLPLDRAPSAFSREEPLRPVEQVADIPTPSWLPELAGRSADAAPLQALANQEANAVRRGSFFDLPPPLPGGFHSLAPAIGAPARMASSLSDPVRFSPFDPGRPASDWTASGQGKPAWLDNSSAYRAGEAVRSTEADARAAPVDSPATPGIRSKTLPW